MSRALGARSVTLPLLAQEETRTREVSERGEGSTNQAAPQGGEGGRQGSERIQKARLKGGRERQAREGEDFVASQMVPVYCLQALL